MTTFQYIIDAILQTLTHIIPLSDAIVRDLTKVALQWGEISPELKLLVAFTGSAVFLIFFRYDWLGIFSALIKSILQPRTLRAESRILDQQILILLALVCLPAFFAQHLVKQSDLGADYDTLIPLLLSTLGFLATAIGLQFAASWNKRIKGLNHLRIVDGVLIAALACLSALPSVPLAAVLWIGFAVTNYHYEAVFKYSMLIIGLSLFTTLAQLLANTSLPQALEGVGYLNSVAVLVLSFTTFWVTIEQLQKNLSEYTLKSFKWVSIFSLLFTLGLFFWMRSHYAS